jgi:hypothetical protein
VFGVLVILLAMLTLGEHTLCIGADCVARLFSILST